MSCFRWLLVLVMGSFCSSSMAHADQLVILGEYGLVRLSADIQKPVTVLVVLDRAVSDSDLISLKQKGGTLEIPMTTRDGSKLVFNGVAAGTWRLHGDAKAVKQVTIDR